MNNLHPMMTEEEIDDAIPALINWFESQQINPRDSGRVMIKLLAAEYVRKSRDAAELQDAVDLTAWMLAIDIAGFLPPKGQWKKPRVVKGGLRPAFTGLDTSSSAPALGT